MGANLPMASTSCALARPPRSVAPPRRGTEIFHTEQLYVEQKYIETMSCCLFILCVFFCFNLFLRLSPFFEATNRIIEDSLRPFANAEPKTKDTQHHYLVDELLVDSSGSTSK